MDDVSLHLLARWREGDQHAATELYERYAERLIALARSRLSAKLAARFDPEDVVQSACRSFFARARAGQFALQQSDDLWQLLVAITLHKLRRQVKHHQADKRAIDHEASAPTATETFGLPIQALARDPAPDEAAALTDVVEEIMRGSRPVDGRIIEMRLQGYTVEEIAAETRRSERTVWRVLEQLKQRLEQWYVRDREA
jgi:RNA polymerase sigma factor (sigma-70 family)